MTFIDEEFSASLLYFSDRKKYLLTIKNSEYNYQNESIWLSEQTKEELFDLITSEIEKRPKYKNIEVILDSGVVQRFGYYMMPFMSFTTGGLSTVKPSAASTPEILPKF